MSRWISSPVSSASGCWRTGSGRPATRIAAKGVQLETALAGRDRGSAVRSHGRHERPRASPGVGPLEVRRPCRSVHEPEVPGVLGGALEAVQVELGRQREQRRRAVGDAQRPVGRRHRLEPSACDASTADPRRHDRTVTLSDPRVTWMSRPGIDRRPWNARPSSRPGTIGSAVQLRRHRPASRRSVVAGEPVRRRVARGRMVPRCCARAIVAARHRGRSSWRSSPRRTARPNSVEDRRLVDHTRLGVVEHAGRNTSDTAFRPPVARMLYRELRRGRRSLVGHAGDRARSDRQPRQAAGVRVPVGRDLRRVPQHLRLRPARRAAAAQRAQRLDPGDGPRA